ncbi:hypothetical protein BD414DRAFT_580898 [Trametes punicea]|nr:hypothetical protein BD414DRAFT_580898 [Trametes punicea]
MGNNNKTKIFVESKDAAIDLAKSVAHAEEQKFRAKVQAHQSKASAQEISSEQKHKVTSKARLERAKAAVAAQAARAKRDKAKLRKKAKASTAGGDDASKSQTDSGDMCQTRTGEVLKKRVTFG